jgi:hypothetical protein
VRRGGEGGGVRGGPLSFFPAFFPLINPEASECRSALLSDQCALRRSTAAPTAALHRCGHAESLCARAARHVQRGRADEAPKGARPAVPSSGTSARAPRAASLVGLPRGASRWRLSLHQRPCSSAGAACGSLRRRRRPPLRHYSRPLNPPLVRSLPLRAPQPQKEATMVKAKKDAKKASDKNTPKSRVATINLHKRLHGV